MREFRAGLSVSVVLVTLAVGCVALIGATPPDRAAQDGETLVVAPDDDASYDAVQAAVDDATAGDTVVVRPGTYRESVTVDADIRLVAPEGATLDGRGTDAFVGLRIDGERPVAPVVDGFRIVGYDRGIETGLAGDWVFRGGVVRDSRKSAVVVRSDGDWTLRDTVVENTSWNAVAVSGSDGNWTLREVTVRETGLAGVEAYGATGNWTLRNVTIETAAIGVNAGETNGPWTIRGVTIANVSESEDISQRMPPQPEGVAIHAGEATGTWSVENATFRAVAGSTVAAPDASQGTVTASTWEGSETPDEDDCTGAVICGEQAQLQTPPAATTEPGDAAETAPSPTTDPDPSTATPAPSPSPQSLSPTATLLALALLSVVALRRRRRR